MLKLKHVKESIHTERYLWSVSLKRSIEFELIIPVQICVWSCRLTTSLWLWFCSLESFVDHVTSLYKISYSNQRLVLSRLWYGVLGLVCGAFALCWFFGGHHLDPTWNKSRWLNHCDSVACVSTELRSILSGGSEFVVTRLVIGIRTQSEKRGLGPHYLV